MSGQKNKVVRHNLTGNSTALPMYDKGAAIPVFQPGVIAVLIAKYVLTLAYFLAMFRHLGATERAGHSEVTRQLLGCFYIGAPKHLVNALPGHAILPSYLCHGEQISLIGSDDVSLLLVCQMTAFHRYILLALIADSLHYNKRLCKREI